MNKNNYSNPLDKARELGSAIINSKEYSELKEAEKQFLNDKASDLLDSYNSKMKEYSNLVSKKDRNLEEEESLMAELKDLKKEIDNNEVINYQYECQKKYDKLIKDINDIINYMTGNNQKKSGCSGCSGCHKNG
ncbi:YlbF family regulator [Sporosalibacterium faouarense]|uniref:YlbF family regulator n=1 Tax=Sporosalibacterium faouarense TaxID=516123 RepID=UPI00141D2971|nr:YlbF family regulator [Sporosalibacterium faouarense]MTI48132.1 YlbF family regulator [Bacillota bacterium]